MQLEKFNLSPQSIKINRTDIYTVLGGTSESKALIDEYIDEIFENADNLLQITGGYLISDKIEFDPNQKTILIENVLFDIKNIVYQQLKASEKIAVFVCTIGDAVYEKARFLMNNGEMLLGYIYDIFGSLVVEEAMNQIQNNLKNEVLSYGMNISNRYSPGYCGWVVSEQQKLFGLLPEKFCGISLSDSCLMQPIKSISGFIGIGNKIKHNDYTCEICNASQCLYKNLKNKL